MYFVDYETASRADLRKCGAYAYARHPSTWILLVAVAEGLDGPVRVRPSLGDTWFGADTVVHWSPFDRIVAQKLDQTDFTSLDLQSVALYLGLPKSLDACAEGLGLAARKDPAGKRLLAKYSHPDPDGHFRPMTNADRCSLASYCAQDVVVMREIYLQLAGYLPAWRRDAEERYWLVARANARGAPIDVAAARSATNLLARVDHDLALESRRLVGIKPSQNEKLAWLLGTKNVTSETVEKYLARTDLHPRIRRAVEIRKLTSKASVKKLDAMIEMAGDDGYARGCLTANGAHTGRLTSEIIQLQNMKKGERPDSFYEALVFGRQVERTESLHADVSEGIRGFIRAPKGKMLIQADLSQIEARVIAWMAGQDDLLEAFRDGRDVYREFAAEELYRLALAAVSLKQRAVGKFAVLACGFGMGENGLSRQALKYDLPELETDLVECGRIVSVYRNRFRKVVSLWGDLERAFRAVVHGTVAGMSVGKVRFDLDPNRHVVMTLPSGRAIHYLRPSIDTDGSILFSGRLKNGKLGIKKTYGGSLAENAAQGIAADVMFEGWAAIEESGFSPFLSVHDELVSLIDEHLAGRLLPVYVDLMSQTPSWADGLPVKAEGCVSRRFKK